MIFKAKYWHELFETGVFLKALNSLWEMATGAIVFLSVHPILHGSFLLFSIEEYLGDRHEPLFRLAAQHLNHLSVSTKNFIGVYLLLHGLLNMFLAYNLYKNRLWAYPLSVFIVGLFLTYQLYRLSHTHSLILLGITLFDIAFMGLTWHEYLYQKRKLQRA